jgi:hypothetical protein
MKKQRKKKKRKQLTVLEIEQAESQTFFELLEVLDELEKKGDYVDVQICVRCKSPKVRRVGSMSGDVLGHMAITPVKFECMECGWRGRLVLKATNRPLGFKEVVIIAEALDLKEKTD